MSGCLGKKIAFLQKYVLCCGSEINVESNDTHNGTVNCTSIEVEHDYISSNTQCTHNHRRSLTSHSSNNRHREDSPMLPQTRCLYIQYYEVPESP